MFTVHSFGDCFTFQEPDCVPTSILHKNVQRPKAGKKVPNLANDQRDHETELAVQALQLISASRSRLAFQDQLTIHSLPAGTANSPRSEPRTRQKETAASRRLRSGLCGSPPAPKLLQHSCRTVPPPSHLHLVKLSYRRTVTTSVPVQACPPPPRRQRYRMRRPSPSSIAVDRG